MSYQQKIIALFNQYGITFQSDANGKLAVLSQAQPTGIWVRDEITLAEYVAQGNANAMKAIANNENLAQALQNALQEFLAEPFEWNAQAMINV